MVRKSVLSNGLRVLTEDMPSMVSSTIGIWVENGSRYEVPAENGLSHFIEHLLFKGTKKRTAAQIAEEIDAVGGVLNAFTGKEYTCYYAKVLGDDLKMATALLADIFLDSVFDQDEITRERQVVIQEISQAEDTPDDFIHDLFTLDFWKGHPLALPIFGSPATVNTFDRKAVVDFMAERYRAERIFISAAGKVDHDSLVRDCERLFNSVAGNGKRDKVAPPSVHPSVLNQHKDLEQAHLVMGGPGLAYGDPLRYASYVLNTALGGGMSSRLFQEVREKRGRVYSIYSFMSSCVDAGYVAIYAGTNPEWVEEVIEVTLAELKKVKRDGLTATELDRAKSQIKGNMLLGMESTDSRMNRLARNEIYFRRDVPLEELAKGIESVTNDQLIELAARCFPSSGMAMVTLGDLKGRNVAADVFSALS
ncbi:MAG TPA: pitrilysin family protein [Candidatus Binataceae bacterium]|nr:pitrilysin family protein [Candidatus Binataceae bacterium]